MPYSYNLSSVSGNYKLFNFTFSISETVHKIVQFQFLGFTTKEIIYNLALGNYNPHTKSIFGGTPILPSNAYAVFNTVCHIINHFKGLHSSFFINIQTDDKRLWNLYVRGTINKFPNAKFEFYNSHGHFISESYNHINANHYTRIFI